MQPGGFSPYAPPAGDYRTNVIVPPGQQRGPLPSTSLRTWKLVCGVAWMVFGFLGFALFGVGAAAGENGTGLLIGGLVTLFASNLPLVGAVAFGTIRLYRLWAWLPPTERHAKLWKRYISPGAAAALMLVPYFNFFWIFVVYFGTCDALDRMRVAYPTSRPPPRNLALATCISVFVFFPASLVLDYVFDKEIDAIAAEMEPRIPPPSP